MSPIAATPFERPGDVQVDLSAVGPYLFGTEAAAELLFVNGRAVPGLRAFVGGLPSLPALTVSEARRRAGVPIAWRRRRARPYLGRIADFERAAFSALNTAFFEDAAVVFVAPGAVLEAPMNLVFVSTGGRARRR